MNDRIIVIKREFAPVVMHPQGYGYYIQWDYKPEFDEEGNELEHGTCVSVHAPYRKPTIGLVKYLVTNYYNDLTNRKIYEGFKFRDKTVYLTTENQANYSSAYMLAVQSDGANLPYKIKCGSDEEGAEYFTFNSLGEFSEFYLALNNHINKCLNDGWEAKDAMDYSVFETALENVPDLPEGKNILTNTL